MLNLGRSLKTIRFCFLSVCLHLARQQNKHPPQTGSTGAFSEPPAAFSEGPQTPHPDLLEPFLAGKSEAFLGNEDLEQFSRAIAPPLALCSPTVARTSALLDGQPSSSQQQDAKKGREGALGGAISGCRNLGEVPKKKEGRLGQGLSFAPRPAPGGGNGRTGRGDPRKTSGEARVPMTQTPPAPPPQLPRRSSLPEGESESEAVLLGSPACSAEGGWCRRAAAGRREPGNALPPVLKLSARGRPACPSASQGSS